MQKVKENYTLGVDFGTLSARAIILRTADGAIAANHSHSYVHGVLDSCLPDGTALPAGYALSWPEDFIVSMAGAVQGALKEAGISPRQIIGIGIDSTSCTLIPTDGQGKPLCEYPGLDSRPHAYAKVWKHHAAEPFARYFEQLARKEQETFLKDCGNSVSCEWAVPKMLEIRRYDPELYHKISYFLDLPEWLTWKMTGCLTRSVASAGYKFHWKEDRGYPARGFLDRAAPGFGREFYEKAAGVVLQLASPAGKLTAQMAERLGLPTGLTVAVGSLDGHIAATAAGISGEHECVLITGTSNVIAFLSKEYRYVPGICGCVYGGIKPGFYSYEAGQACTGDMLDWFTKNLVPQACFQEAEDKGIGIHQLLSEKAAAGHPDSNPLTILDWMNGSRNLPSDSTLKSGFIGMSLASRPEDIYCAMIQGIACTTRFILEHCEAHGFSFERIVATGGIPSKNPFYMQQYANILGRDIDAAVYSDLPAMGSAIQAACAVGKAEGGYDSLEEAEDHMKWRTFIRYQPDRTYRKEYETIFDRFRFYRTLLSEERFVN